MSKIRGLESANVVQSGATGLYRPLNMHLSHRPMLARSDSVGAVGVVADSILTSYMGAVTLVLD